MKKIALLALSGVAMWAQFGFVPSTLAWKPKPPFCYINCGVPVGNISANPQTVVLPSHLVAGSTQLRWEWDFVGGGPLFDLGCIYVEMNASGMSSLVTCEWPGNRNYYDAPWIVADNVYTFRLSPNVGNTVSTWSLRQFAGDSEVTVVGVIGSSGGSGPGPGGPGPGPGDNPIP